MTALARHELRSHLHERDIDLLTDDQFANLAQDLTAKQRAALDEHIAAERARVEVVLDKLVSIQMILAQPVYPEPDTTPPPAEAAPDGEPTP